MSEINRFEHNRFEMVETDWGDWVEHRDHLKVVTKKLREYKKKLAKFIEEEMDTGRDPSYILGKLTGKLSQENDDY